MRLEDLAKQPAELRDGLSKIIVNDPQYHKVLGANSRFFASQELAEIEKQYSGQGLTFKQIEAILAKKGMVIKPPTFKRYVGLKLVSGTSSIHKTKGGSVGFYPGEVIRQINLIKYLLESKRDFLECYVAALGATPSNALQIVESNDPDALNISENLGNFRVDAVVKKHLDDLLSHKFITRAERDSVLSKVKAFRDACDDIFETSGALRDALKNISVPGRYTLGKLFEALNNKCPEENNKEQERG
jgi:hypothetical protein